MFVLFDGQPIGFSQNAYAEYSGHVIYAIKETYEII